MDLTEKRWLEIPAKSFTANGTSLGVVTLDDTTGFRVKQKVVIKASAQANLDVEVKRVVSSTTLEVGPRSSDMSERSDLTSYTTAASASIIAPEQLRATISLNEGQKATYAEEPTIAVRVINVDKYGNYAAGVNLTAVETPVAYDASTPITTAAWTQLKASTSVDIKEVEIINTTTKLLYLGIGATGSEVIRLVIPANGNGKIPLIIPAGSKISAKAVNSNTSTGNVIINFYG